MTACDGERSSQIPPLVERRLGRERARLYRAAAILRCLEVASAHADDLPVTSAVETARRLVDKALNQLDSVVLLRPETTTQAGGRREAPFGPRTYRLGWADAAGAVREGHESYDTLDAALQAGQPCNVERRQRGEAPFTLVTVNRVLECRDLTPGEFAP